ncbi:MAG: sugar phosphate isomerase/epimerase [Clostridiaceae bacterium]|nr:sugar phosphate isomerase/epimerase [Clostridiaceae bacterium]
MRIGINHVPSHSDPEEWADILVKEGYRATVFPVNYLAKDSVIGAYVKAAKERDILLAEIGIWDSPFQKDPVKAEQVIEKSYRSLELADHVGASCCVNVSGGTGDPWYFLDRGNFGDEIYQRNVEFIQTMLDKVKPKNTYFTLEPMQWMLPDSPEQYAQLIRDVNRERFAVHMDIVNWVKDPYSYTHQEELIDQAFSLLGPHIRSCHLKDCRLDVGLTVAIREVLLGEGDVPIRYYLEQINKLDPDMPVLLEHLPDMDAYRRAKKNLDEIWL